MTEFSKVPVLGKKQGQKVNALSFLRVERALEYPQKPFDLQLTPIRIETYSARAQTVCAREDVALFVLSNRAAVGCIIFAEKG